MRKQAHGLTIVLLSQECRLFGTLKVMNTYMPFSTERKTSMGKPSPNSKYSGHRILR